MSSAAWPDRFRSLMEKSGRDVTVSRPIVALIRAEGHVTRLLEEAMAPSGLTLPQFNVLMELSIQESGVMPIYELMNRLVRSAPNTSALIARMEAAELVTKERSHSDQRVVLVRIGKKGWRSLSVAAPRVFATEKRILEGIPRRDLRTTATVLEQVARRSRAECLGTREVS